MGGRRHDKKFDAVVYNVETSEVEVMPYNQEDEKMEQAFKHRLIAPGKIAAYFVGSMITYTRLGSE